MIVIVEGIDRVGKTTLCDMLVSKLGFTKFKDEWNLVPASERDESNTMQDAIDINNFSHGKLDSFMSMLKLADSAGQNVVVDRFHLTEAVYSIVKRCRPNKEARYAFVEVDNWIVRNLSDVTLVLVKPKNLVWSAKESGDDISTADEMDKMFNSFYSSTQIQHKCITDFSTLWGTLTWIKNITFRYDFYFASPFFNPEQVEREETMKERLRVVGCRVFSPKEATHLKSTASNKEQSDTFKQNLDAINNSFAVFAVTDGKDMGTIWECGYAYGKSKPIVYFAETLGKNAFNLMLAQSGVDALRSRGSITHDIIDMMLKGVKHEYEGLIE